jgi:hypothetical protein
MDDEVGEVNREGLFMVLLVGRGRVMYNGMRGSEQ